MKRITTEELAGQTFGSLTVIQVVYDDESKRTFAVCNCSDCGNTKKIRPSCLKLKTSCGCKQRLSAKIGDKFGKWTVTDVLDTTPTTVEVVCECGNKATRILSRLRDCCLNCGRKEGNRKRRIARIGSDDLIGMVFGSSTVESISNRKGTSIMLNVICTCGKRRVVSISDLHNGRSTECKHCCCRKDYTGQRFGKLFVERLVDTRGDSRFICLCDCGKRKEVGGPELFGGKTRSCGCMKSWAERNIAVFFDYNGVEYKREFTYADCKDKARLRFDFRIKNGEKEFLIEYHGIQHYEQQKFRDSLANIQRRDAIKVKYCQDKQIPLLVLNKNNKDIPDDIDHFLQRAHYDSRWQTVMSL